MINLTIYLCSRINIPLDLSQQQQFSSKEQQKDFFCTTHLYKKITTELTQLESGYMVVSDTFEDLANNGVNYLAIEYPNGKMLYAFITRITPAPNVSHASIYYVKDVWQTRMFDWSLAQSMIERQHIIGKSDTDYVQDCGVNNYVTIGKKDLSTMIKVTDTDGDRWFIVMIACNILTSGGDEDSPKIESSLGGWVDGAFQSCDFLAFPQTSKEWSGKNIIGIADFLATLSVTPWIAAQIQKIVMVPYTMIEWYNYYNFLTFKQKSVIKLNNYLNNNQGFSNTYPIDIQSSKAYAQTAPLSEFANIDEMFRSPYAILTINCINGSSIQLDPGYFTNFTDPNKKAIATFYIQSTISENPRITITPRDYKGESLALDYSLVYDGFPSLTVVYNNGTIAYAQQANSYRAQLGAITANQSYISKSANLNAAMINSQKNLQDYQRNTAVFGSAASAIGSLLSLNIGGAIGNAYNAAATAGQASYQNKIYRNQLAQNDLNAAMQNQNYVNQANILTAARQDALLQGMGVNGMAGGDLLAFSQNYDQFYPMFWSTVKVPPADEMKVIGNQFKFYGFNYPAYQIPNMFANGITYSNSARYNYIKLVSANIIGSLTTEEAGEIKMILQNGVAIYHYPTIINQNMS